MLQLDWSSYIVFLVEEKNMIVIYAYAFTQHARDNVWEIQVS